MTKALLTEKDIKNFILQCVEKAKPRPDVYFVRKVLCRKLTLDEKTFERHYAKNIGFSYIKGKRKYYSIRKVINWLNEHNIPYTLRTDI